MPFKRQLTLALSAFFFFISVSMAASREELAVKSGKDSNGIIQLDDFNFKDILDGPRDFYLIALLTSTEPNVGCTACFDFNPVYDSIVSSWVQDHQDGISKDDGDKAIYFAKSDLSDSNAVPEIFKYYKIERVPRLMFFTPGGGIDDYHLLNLPQQQSSGVLEFIRNVNVAVGINDFVYHKPADWSAFFISAFVAFVSVYLIRKHSKVVYSIINSKTLWAVLCCTFITLMSGGYMYNKMRGTPLAGSDDDGNVIYFLPNEFQGQYGIESQIVSIVYGILSVCFIGLVLGIPKLSDYYNGSASGSLIITVITIVICIATYIFFAGLTNLFSIKSARYPFQLIKISSLLNTDN